MKSLFNLRLIHDFQNSPPQLVPTSASAFLMLSFITIHICKQTNMLPKPPALQVLKKIFVKSNKQLEIFNATNTTQQHLKKISIDRSYTDIKSLSAATQVTTQ